MVCRKTEVSNYRNVFTKVKIKKHLKFKIIKNKMILFLIFKLIESIKPFVKTEYLYLVDKINREQCLIDFQKNCMECEDDQNDVEELKQELANSFKYFLDLNTKTINSLAEALHSNAVNSYQTEMKNVRLNFILFG